MTMVSSRTASFCGHGQGLLDVLVQPAATILCESIAVCRKLIFKGIVRATTFTKLEQRSWIKIEVARGRSTQECFHGLYEARGDAELHYHTVARRVKAYREDRHAIQDNLRTGRHVKNWQEGRKFELRSNISYY